MEQSLHILVLGTVPEWLSGQRGPMIRDFLRRGHRVTAIGTSYSEEVRTTLLSWGVAFETVPLRRAGLNLLADVRAMIAMYRLFRRTRPDLLFCYTVKPVVYGLPLAWLARVKWRYPMITGRGYAFQPGNERSRRIARVIASSLYRFSLRFASGILFHNEDDRALFLDTGMVSKRKRTVRLWGSGIDTEQFVPAPLPQGPTTFLMLTRLIADKGVYEFVEAAEKAKTVYPDARFVLVGPMDPSPNGVSKAEIEAWQHKGVIEYLGPATDVRPHIADCHVMVLPSYGEGLPRSVLEGLAMARAVITTDVPGCRDTVENGVNGLLVEARSSDALADAMIACIRDPAFVRTAGEAGLKLARERFDVRMVNADIASFMHLGDPLPASTSDPALKSA